MRILLLVVNLILTFEPTLQKVKSFRDQACCLFPLYVVLSFYVFWGPPREEANKQQLTSFGLWSLRSVRK
jgi:hypothetical protein